MIAFIAKRLNDKQGTGQVSRPAIVIATAGVAVGLMVMILTVCITLGFKTEIHDMVRNTAGDLRLYNSPVIGVEGQGTLTIGDTLKADIEKFGDIEKVERVVTTLGCLKTDSAFVGVQLVGRESQDSLSKNEIVISEKQASKLGLTTGSKVMAYFFDNNVRARRFTIAGTYATHLSDFDDTQVFTSMTTVRELTGLEDDQCHYAQLWFAGNEKTTVGELPKDLQVLQGIRALMPTTPLCQPTIATTESLHPQVFSWLELLDLNVWVILVLMICVSGFTMMSGLFILILERTQMIGLMKALGARQRTLRGIFLYIAWIIMARGMVIGNVLALTFAWVQSTWHVVKLNPADYYIDAVPIAFPWAELIGLNVATMAITIAILIVPTYIIGHISPVKAMHFD